MMARRSSTTVRLPSWPLLAAWRAWWTQRSSRPMAPVDAYRRWAATYGDTPNALQQLEDETLTRVMPALDNQRVLDLGCGKARGAVRALDTGAAVAFAADRTVAMLTSPTAFRAPGLHRLCAATHPLPFRAHQFDVVLCTLVLGHVEDLDAALGAMARVVAPGGHLVVTDFHPDATQRGWQRTFRDADGAEHVIEQYLHPLARYRQVLKRHSLAVERLEEGQWQGKPVVFALRARKPDDPAAGTA